MIKASAAFLAALVLASNAHCSVLPHAFITSSSFDGTPKQKGVRDMALYGAGVGLAGGLVYDMAWFLRAEVVKRNLFNARLEHHRFKTKSQYYDAELRKNPADPIVQGSAEHAQERKLYYRNRIKFHDRRLQFHNLGYINPIWTAVKGAGHFAGVGAILNLTGEWAGESRLMMGALIGGALNILWQSGASYLSSLGIEPRLPFSKFSLGVAVAGGTLAGYLSSPNK